MLKKTFFSVFVAVVAMASFTFAADEDPCVKPDALTEIDGYYQIGTCGELLKFAEMANANCSINGKLTADIVVNTNVLADADGVSKVDADGNYTGNAPANVWTPIGTSSDKYNGTFDGNGHTIRGLYFNDENTFCVGLFGYINESAKVQNVGVVDSYFKGYWYVGGVVGYNDGGTVSNAYNTGSVSGGFKVGGVVAYNFYGTVSNVYNMGSVSGDSEVGGVVGNNYYGAVSNVYNTGSVSGNSEVGGVVGENNNGTVSNVYNTGSVSGSGFDVGGVVGKNDNGIVSNAYNTGSVSGDSEVGGVVGFNVDGSVSNVYNTGSVSGNFGVGGVVGNNYGTVSNVYNTGIVSGLFYVGGVVGFNYYGTVSNVYNTGVVSGNSEVGGVVGGMDNVDINKAYYDNQTCNNCNSYGTGKPLAELATLTIGSKADDDADFPLLEGETESPWAKGIYYDKATGKLANSNLPYLKSLPKPQDVEMEFKVKDNVIQISSTDDLKNFAKLVNEYGVTDVDAELTGNICLNASEEGDEPLLTQIEALKKEGKLEENSFEQWTPIGTSLNNAYMGKFDGKGNTVSGLYFNDGTKDYVGLFGYIGSGATVQNVGVIDSYIRGYNCVGGVVGDNDGGAISNVYNAGSVSGAGGSVGGVVGINLGSISNVYNTGSVSGGSYVGGVAGSSVKGTVSNVYNTGSVSGAGGGVGGVVGINNWGSISNAYNTGSVSGDQTRVGGVVGTNNGTIGNVYNTGSVSGSRYVGGVVGDNYDGTISNVYNTGSVSGTNDVGGVVGGNNGGGINNAYYDNQTCNNCNSYGTGKPLAELATLTIGSKADADADFPLLEGEEESPWAKGICYDKATGKLANSELPYLKSLPKPQDVEMEFNVKDNVIQISSTDDLKNFAKLVNEYHITDVDAELRKSITLNSNLLGENNANVDAETGEYTGNTPANVWTPIGTSRAKYTGTFDGNGYTIRGLYFNDENTSYVGLFGCIDESAKVQNVGVVDSYFKGKYYVGGVVGGNDGGTIINVYNTGSVSGAIDVGGVVGNNYYGTISNVYNTGAVSAEFDYVGGVVGENNNGTVSNVYNTGSVSGDYEVGGVVGYNNNGTVSNVYNTGSVSGNSEVGGMVGYNNNGTVSNVYNTGSVSGYFEVGGVVGENNGGTISNVYNTGLVSGDSYVGGVVGNNYGSVSNAYYNTEVTCENCSVVEGTTGKSSGEFADGTVAMLLHDWCEMDGEVCKYGGLNGSIWGQDLTAENSLPDFSGIAIEKYGSIIFYVGVDKVDSASIDAAAKDLVTIPNDVVVAGPVKFKRNFSSSGYSTIMLPFKPECAADDCVEGVKFYEFASYKNATVGVTEVSPSALKANTPYLVSVTDGATELVFKNGGTFNTTTSDAYNSETGEYKVELGGDGAGWTIYGTYAYKTWKEGDAGLGRTYGFAANDGVNDPAIVGEFRKVGVGAYIYPMRAYLEYDAPVALARPAANGAAHAFAANTVASLPETIDVVIVDKGNVGTEVAGSDDASGEQTTRVIGTINTRTGEFKFANDRWFDLQGRFLGNKKPTAKGTYYNNGKKVIVK